MNSSNPFKTPTWCAVLLLFFCCAANAHDARPVVLTITATADLEYRFTLTVPDIVSAANAPAAVWPADCRVQGQTLQSGSTGSVRCEQQLEGRDTGLAWPAANPSLSTWIRYSGLDGSESTTLLPPSETRWQVPVTPGQGNIFLQYLRFGVEHLLLGYDHLLFVIGLMVVAGRVRSILLAVTGFTLSHSISLGLSALDLIRVPVPPTEAVIALSILYLAVEIARGDRQSAGFRFPVMVAFLFGLLHGLGFASVLGEIGLADDALLLSLTGFNLGIEAGQVVFVLVVLALFRVIAIPVARMKHLVPDGRRLAEVAAAWLIGVPSAYWFIDRVTQFG